MNTFQCTVIHSCARREVGSACPFSHIKGSTQRGTIPGHSPGRRLPGLRFACSVAISRWRKIVVVYTRGEAGQSRDASTRALRFFEKVKKNSVSQSQYSVIRPAALGARVLHQGEKEAGREKGLRVAAGNTAEKVMPPRPQEHWATLASITPLEKTKCVSEILRP